MVKCTVCDSPNATNYHFGARSCKACAAFFRRSISMQQVYECLDPKSTTPCNINYALRLNCRHCRLEKCYSAGMSKDLVQAKRDQPTVPKATVSQPEVEEVEPQEYDIYYQRSENEWEYSPPEKWSRYSDDLMGVDELQQFIQFQPGPSMDADDFMLTEVRSRLSSSSEGRLRPYYEEDIEKGYGLAEHYVDLTVHLNMRRRITYTDKLLFTVFDGACVCPYEKSDLKIFDHRTYRQKNRNDYTMILDYVNRFPEFSSLSKSEKTVLFRTAAAVDVLVDQAYYSQVIFPDEDTIVTPNGEYLSMNPLPTPEDKSKSGEFTSEDDYVKYKSLTMMKVRQWTRLVVPMKKLNLSVTEFALFKALTIWHHNYYKMGENGREICGRQREEIIKSLWIICEDEGYADPILRASEIILTVGIVMEEVHEMITSYIEITVLDVLDDPILKDMLKFQY